MIDDLDEVLRQLLIRELPIRNNEVDIAFDQPKREWSARLNRPTLNLFLYEVSENKQLRQPQWEVERKTGGQATQRRKPVRVDLNYLISAWATETEDEHRLLTRTLLALLRLPHLPEDLLPDSLRDLPVRERLSHALVKRGRENGLHGAMEYDLRPLLDLVALGTIADIVPLTGENRILVSTGLQRLNDTKRPGRIGIARRYNTCCTIWNCREYTHCCPRAGDCRCRYNKRSLFTYFFENLFHSHPPSYVCAFIIKPN